MKLKFTNINKSFDTFHVLKDVSFEVESGAMFGYLGRNGAGKTTSLRILMDVFEADSGTITMDDKPFDRSHYSIGYLPEERGMYSKSLVKDQLIYFSMLRGASKKQAQESVEKWASRFEISQYLNKKLETLSKGNQQKVQITQAFLNDPDILILDEPFSGLDPVNSQVFQNALKEYISSDKIIIFSSHQMAYVETFCDNIAIINKGEIVLKGSLHEIKKNRAKNKIQLSCESSMSDVLPLIQEYVDSVEQSFDTLTLTLRNNVTKNDIVKALIDKNIQLKMIKDFEPTLHDIFVEEVGDR